MSEINPHLNIGIHGLNFILEHEPSLATGDDLISYVTGFCVAASTRTPPGHFTLITKSPHRHEATSATFLRELAWRLNSAAHQLEAAAALRAATAQSERNANV